MMHVYVTTRGRIDRQLTRSNFMLDRLGRWPVTYVVPESEERLWRPYGVRTMTVPDAWVLCQIHQHLLDKGAPRQLWLDDDMSLSRMLTGKHYLDDPRGDPEKIVAEARRTGIPKQAPIWYPCQPVVDVEEVQRLMQYLENRLDEGYAQIGTASADWRMYWLRSLATAEVHPEDVLAMIGQRIQCVHALNVDVINRHGIRVDPIQEWEDMLLSVCLLKAGEPILTTYRWSHQQHGSNAAGGCSVYRTLENYNAASIRFAELHPDVVQNKTIRAKGFGTKQSVSGWKERVGIQIAWGDLVERCKRERERRGDPIWPSSAHNGKAAALRAIS